MTKTRTMKWELIKTDLTCTHLDDKDRKDTFDLGKFFSGFEKFTAVQKYLIEYGAKQRLADCCARPKDMKLTPAERSTEMAALYTLWIDGRTKAKASDRNTMNKKVAAAKEAATPAELKVMKKLGLI